MSKGLNAPADSQAQSYATKIGTLAADPSPITTEADALSSGLNTSNIAPLGVKGLTETASSAPASAKDIAERALGTESSTIGGTSLTSATTDRPTTATSSTPAAVLASSSSAAAADRPPTATSTYSTTNDAAPLKKEKSPFDPKTDNGHLAAPEGRPLSDSRDVSPMSKGPKTGEERPATAASTTTPVTTPKREKSKRASGFFNKGTPDSTKTGGESAHGSPGGAENSKPKKKGFLAKLKDKLKG